MSRLIPLLVLLLLQGCTVTSPNQDKNVASRMLDAFYSFDREALSAWLAPGADADRLLYYQGWAEAADYRIQTRYPCQRLESGEIECAVTVTDNFGKTLGYTATDTFRMQITDTTITAISFEGDDPPIFMQVFEWIGQNRPEVLAGPCLNLFEGGTTPGDCARAVVSAAQAFMKEAH